MSKNVESTVTPDETSVESTPKKFNFSRKQIAVAVAAVAGTAAAVAIAIKLKNDGLVEDAAEAVTDAVESAAKA